MNATLEKHNIPNAFKTIYDQDTAIRILSKSITNNRISHGYLFWGPEGVGKKLTAKAFAKSVLCSDKELLGCNNCNTCIRIEKEVHPDLLIIKPTGKTRLITVDTIEEIIHLAHFRPYEGDRRFVIFDDAERIGIPAQTHFLKTLEEPPSNTTFVLVTCNPGLILSTIRSRCQPVRFQHLQPGTIKKILVGKKSLREDEATKLANLSQGQISRALEIYENNKPAVILEIFNKLSLKRDPLKIAEEFENFLDTLRKSAESEFPITSAEKKELSPEEINQLKEIIISEIEAKVSQEFESCLFLINCLLRDMLIYHQTKEESMLYYPEVVSIYQHWQPEKIHFALEFLEKVRGYIRRNIDRGKAIRDLFFVLSPYL